MIFINNIVILLNKNNNTMSNNENKGFRISTGPAASNAYDNEGNQLTVDWAFDAAYYKHKDGEWITISLGPITEKCDIDKINNGIMKEKFKILCLYAYTNIKGYSEISDKALEELKKKLKTLVI